MNLDRPYFAYGVVVAVSLASMLLDLFHSRAAVIGPIITVLLILSWGLAGALAPRWGGKPSRAGFLAGVIAGLITAIPILTTHTLAVRSSPGAPPVHLTPAALAVLRLFGFILTWVITALVGWLCGWVGGLITRERPVSGPGL